MTKELAILKGLAWGLVAIFFILNSLNVFASTSFFENPDDAFIYSNPAIIQQEKLVDTGGSSSFGWTSATGTITSIATLKKPANYYFPLLFLLILILIARAVKEQKKRKQKKEESQY